MNKPFIKIISIIIILFSVILSHLQAENKSFETAWLQTDRNVYVTGENIQFKLYVTNPATGKLSDTSNTGYIIIRGVNRAPFSKQRVKISSGISFGSISLPDTLNSGVYQIIGFTNFMRNAGEQTFPRKEIIIINRFDNELKFKMPVIEHSKPTTTSDGSLNINLNKTTFHTREKVTIRIKSTVSNANVSVSVTEKTPLLDRVNTSFYPEFKQQTTIDTPFLEEKRGKILRGKVTDINTNQPVENATVLLSCADTVANLQYAQTDPKGAFQMPLNSYYDGKELYFTIYNGYENSSWRISIDDAFALTEYWNPSLKTDVGSLREFLIKSQKMADINIAYTADNENKIIQQESYDVCSKFYNCVPMIVKPADYTLLNNFREITVEILPQVKLNSENGRIKLNVQNNNSQQVYKNRSSAVFLDGVYLDDTEKLMGLNSDKIKKIEVVGNERIFGDFVYNGAVSVFTKTNEIEKSKPESFSLKIKNDKETAPEYASEVDINQIIQDKRYPYFKQTLYWNPNLNILSGKDTIVEFFTSDNEGDFNIEIAGVTEQGKIIMQNLEIHVAD